MKKLTDNNHNILREVKLLKLLELPNGVSKKEIRKAYYRISKKCHPDLGGDSDIYTEIVEAYNILMDEKRREYFNLTGNKVFIDAKIIKEEAAKQVEKLFDDLLKHYKYDILTVDVIEVVELRIQREKEQLENEINNIKKILEKLDKASSKTITDEDQPNLILSVIENGKNHNHKALLEIEKLIAIMDHSLIIINHQNFDFDLVIQTNQNFKITFSA